MTGVFNELALLTYPEAGLNSGSAISFFISLFQVGMCQVVGRNHVNETAMHGIIAHHLWEENLGNITDVFVNDSFGIVARTLCFHYLNPISERNNFELLFSLLG